MLQQNCPGHPVPMSPTPETVTAHTGVPETGQSQEDLGYPWWAGMSQALRGKSGLMCLHGCLGD